MLDTVVCCPNIPDLLPKLLGVLAINSLQRITTSKIMLFLGWSVFNNLLMQESNKAKAWLFWPNSF